MTDLAKARWMLLATGLLFSTGGTVVKWTSFSAWQVTTLRSAIAAIFLLLFIPQSRKGWSPRVLLVSIAYAMTLTLFVLANKLTTAANTTFLQSTAPLYVLVLSPILLRETVKRSDLITLLLLALGMSLFFFGAEDPTDISPDPVLGNALGACAGLSWALVVIGFRSLSKHGEHTSAASAAALGSILACAISLPFAVPFDLGTLHDWLAVGYLGVFQIGLAYLLFSLASPRIRAFEASLILMIEPALAPLWAWLVHDEVPAAMSLAGGGIIVAGLVLRTLMEQD